MMPAASTIAAAPRWRLSTRSPRRTSTRTGSDWSAWLDIALALWGGEMPPFRARRGDASGLAQLPGSAISMLGAPTTSQYDTAHASPHLMLGPQRRGYSAS